MGVVALVLDQGSSPKPLYYANKMPCLGIWRAKGSLG